MRKTRAQVRGSGTIRRTLEAEAYSLRTSDRASRISPDRTHQDSGSKPPGRVRA